MPYTDDHKIFKNATALEINDTLQALNHLISHQNAAIDLLASDKRAALVTDMEALAELAKNGELLEAMDYGDQIAPAWHIGETSYTPFMNLCHTGRAELEDGETIDGGYFEWDKTTPVGIPFDAPEAIYYFDGTEAPGDYHIEIGGNYGDGWKAGDAIQITLTETPAEGDQLVIECNANNALDPTAGRPWKIYAKGGTEVKQSGTTAKGTSGTLLGSTAADPHATNGKANAPSRVVYGYNRWAMSGLRQWLNSDKPAGGWWQAMHAWDRPPAQAATTDGFLTGYEEGVKKYFMPIKVVTVAGNADSNVEDVTYDRVFLASLEQMYCAPQFAGKEGEYWEYYKRLMGRTTPAPTGYTYARLIKYALNAPTSAQYCIRRSAHRPISNLVWSVYTSGNVTTYGAVYATRCAPSVFISK